MTPEHGIKDNFNIPCSGNPVKENFLKGGHGMGAGSPKTPDGRDPGVIRRPDEGRPLIEIDYVPVQHFLISQNITKMKERFPLTSGGVFGEKGKNVRVIRSDDPLKTSEEFAGMLTEGMKKKPLVGKQGWRVDADDGTVIIWRPKSKTPDSPAVDIGTRNVKNPVIKDQKIHFLEKENEK